MTYVDSINCKDELDLLNRLIEVYDRRISILKDVMSMNEQKFRDNILCLHFAFCYKNVNVNDFIKYYVKSPFCSSELSEELLGGEKDVLHLRNRFEILFLEEKELKKQVKRKFGEDLCRKLIDCSE